MSVNVSSIEHWHQLRAQNIGASEVAALFSQCPYMTKKMLWHVKNGDIDRPSLDDNERIKWGNRLESAIAFGIAEDEGWQIQKAKRYITHKRVKGMGASLDFEILNHPNGPACFEIKNVDWLRYKQTWNDRASEAPIHIELQLQHQMAVRNTKWGAIGVLVGGNEAKTIIRNRNERTIAIIEKAVDEFWSSIERNLPPRIEFAEDLAALKLLYPRSADGKLLKADEDLEALCDERAKYAAAEKANKMAKDKVSARIIEVMKDAEGFVGELYCGSYRQQKRGCRVLKINEVKKGCE